MSRPTARDRRRARGARRARAHASSPSLQDAGGAYPASPDVLGLPRLRLVARRRLHRRRDLRATATSPRPSGSTTGAPRCSTHAADRSTSIVDAPRRGRPAARRGDAAHAVHVRRRDGRDAWWDFQIDGYGMWLWARGAARAHGTGATSAGGAGDRARRRLPRRAPGTARATTGGRSTPSTGTSPPSAASRRASAPLSARRARRGPCAGRDRSAAATPPS